MMSLARLFKTELHLIPTPIPYVFPNNVSLSKFAKKLGATNRKRIGIAWRGSALNNKNPNSFFFFK